MMRYVRMSLFLLAAMVAGLPAAYAASASVFYVPLNRSELFTTSVDMGEVIVTDPEVANIVVHGKRRVSVIGKQIGQTTLRAFDAKHNLIRSMDVSVTYDLPAVRRALREFLPNEHIGVSMVNTRIALVGEVSGAEPAARAMEIAEQFVHGKLSDDKVDSRKKADGVSEQSPIINLMKIRSGQQVMLRIRIGEIQRSAIKNLGVNLTAVGDGSFNFSIGTGTGMFGVPSANADGANTFGFNSFYNSNPQNSYGSMGFRNGNALAGTIDALERDGLIKILAEPNLVALSGEEAQFLAGGEFPIVVPQSLGQNTIEYKPYGVALKFTPFVLSENRLRIKVNPEVSDVSEENAVVIGSTTAKSIITRRASTTVELAPGETFMIAGLIRDNITSTINQLPGVAEVPVLSALFRSTAFQRNETELVIAVTPYLVDPVKGSDLKLPTDDFRPASFMDSIFFGALGGVRGAKNPSLEGPSGFMTDN
jgi:pilus assembly protein CpaC